MGGAMDLVACGSKVVVVMEHTAKNSKKLLPVCNLPLTAKGVVSMVITELAVFENRAGKLVLTEIAEGTTLEEVQSKTGFPIVTAAEIKKF
jgi:3-oxoacid CoA-transferase B subunit